MQAAGMSAAKALAKKGKTQGTCQKDCGKSGDMQKREQRVMVGGLDGRYRI